MPKLKLTQWIRRQSINMDTMHLFNTDNLIFYATILQDLLIKFNAFTVCIFYKQTIEFPVIVDTMKLTHHYHRLDVAENAKIPWATCSLK